MVERVDYQIARPPGWVHIPVGENAAATTASFAHSAVQSLPVGDRAVAETILATQLSQAVQQAMANGGQDLFFPGETVNGAAVPMSIVVAQSPLSANPASTSKMEALTSFSIRSSTSEVRSVGGEPAIRQYEEIAAQVDDAQRIVSPANRRVTYLTWSAGTSPKLMLFVATILRLDSEDGEALLEALEFLFDTMITTVRFSAEEEIA